MALPLTYNLRNVVVRWRVTLLAVGGIALVCAVLIVLAAMAAGFSAALRATGSVENAIVTQRGSNSELTSGLSRDHANTILVDARVQRNREGKPLASPEQLIVASLPRRHDGAEVNVSVRGVTPMAFEVRRGLRIEQGRSFTPGLYELVVGARAAQRYRGLDLGGTIKIQRRSWTIVGVFSADGSGFESELWGDVEVMGPAFNRAGGYQSLTVRLSDPASVAAFDADLQRNPHFQVQMTPERSYYENQSGNVAAGLLALAVFVAIVMGIGAVFGAMNTMYGIVAARTREIGTLRALGFSRAAVLTAFVIESVVLALVGGAVGCLVALPVNGMASSAGGANFSEVAFAFRVTPTILGLALVFAAVLGIAGGALPALKASRLPITAALREA